MSLYKSIFIILVFFIAGCNDSTEISKPKGKSFEIEGGDTCNFTDDNGRKQGVWYTRKKVPGGYEITDTLWYKDGVVMEKSR